MYVSPSSEHRAPDKRAIGYVRNTDVERLPIHVLQGALHRDEALGQDTENKRYPGTENTLQPRLPHGPCPGAFITKSLYACLSANCTSSQLSSLEPESLPCRLFHANLPFKVHRLAISEPKAHGSYPKAGKPPLAIRDYIYCPPGISLPVLSFVSSFFSALVSSFSVYHPARTSPHPSIRPRSVFAKAIIALFSESFFMVKGNACNGHTRRLTLKSASNWDFGRATKCHLVHTASN